MSGDDSDEQHKLIFANAGAALYHAQVLEEAVTSFILIISVSKKRVPSKAAFDALDQVLRAKTLGGLLKEARKHLKITAAAEKQIDTALDQRNELVHHFFKNHAEAFFSEAGRNRMIAKLEGYQSSFCTAADTVGSIGKKILAKFGVTDEMLAQKVEEMKKNA
ncbi:MAG TPA: hypothetical protein VMC06_07525 [Opitutaceae bacterium]|nr:hypothetical protein [Opitutaceae bacterium]